MSSNFILAIIADVLDKNSQAMRKTLLRLPEIKDQKTKREYIKSFQKELATGLGHSEGVEISIFQRLDNTSDFHDRADIFIENYYPKHDLIIEFDATRADQVAKKMLSRYYYAAQASKPLTYVAILYPGPPSSNPEECKKYFKMGDKLLKSINQKNELIGYIVEDLSRKEADYRYLSCSPISYDKALDPEYYKDFLLSHDVKSIDSVENYKRPLHVILNHHPAISYEDFLSQLRKESANSEMALGWVSKTYYDGKPLKGNTKSYWRKYIDFLHSSLQQ